MKQLPVAAIGVVIGILLCYIYLSRTKQGLPNLEKDAPGRVRNKAFLVDSSYDVALKKNVLNVAGQNRFFFVQISKAQLTDLLAKERFDRVLLSTVGDDGRRQRNSYFSAFAFSTDTTTQRGDSIPGFEVLATPFPKLFKQEPIELGTLTLSKKLILTLIDRLKGSDYAALRIEPMQNSAVSGKVYLVDGAGAQVGIACTLQPCPPYKPDVSSCEDVNQ